MRGRDGAMRHTKPRFRMRMRMAAIQRRRKGVEFMTDLASNPFFYFRKKSLIDRKPGSKEDNISAKA